MTSGPEATGAKNNISAVDRQPINNIKPQQRMPPPEEPADRYNVAACTVTIRSRQQPVASLKRTAALVTQVTELSKVDIGRGLQHDRRMMTLRTRRIARDGLHGSRLPLVLLTRSHGG